MTLRLFDSLEEPNEEMQNLNSSDSRKLSIL